MLANSSGLDEVYQGSVASERYQNSAADDPDDPPLSVSEWLLFGGVVVALWWFVSWRHQRHQWLNMLPVNIWRTYVEFSAPCSLLLSPFFAPIGSIPILEGLLRDVLEGDL